MDPGPLNSKKRIRAVIIMVTSGSLPQHSRLKDITRFLMLLAHYPTNALEKKKNKMPDETFFHQGWLSNMGMYQSINLAFSYNKKIAIYAPMIYTAPCIMLWMPAYPLQDAKEPKNSRFSGPNPLPFAQVMDMHASKKLCTGLYKS
jgi:hypothetical protein